jgi:uncharacterized protein (TIGR02453 family)
MSYLGSAFSHLGKNGSCPGYYFELNSSGRIMIGGGWYMLDSQILYKIRKSINKDATPLRQILEKPDFKKTFGNLSGQKLKTVPRGFSPHSPNIDLLGYKNYIVAKNLDVNNLSDQQIAAEIIKTFKVLMPLVVYLRQPFK